MTLFCKHLYYNPKIERDIQIFLSQDSLAPPEKSKQMFPKNESQASISKQQAKHELLFKYRNCKSYGFSLENYRFELLLQQLKPEKII